VSDVVAERALDYFGADGVAGGLLQIEAPKPDQNDWRCEYTLTWPGFVKRRYAMGVDSYQALSLALISSVVEIAASDDFKAGRIGALGEKIRTRRELKEVFGVHRLPGFDP
jgi:hypothetical protein